MFKHIRTHWAPYQLEQWQMELLRQNDKGQPVPPSRKHLWMHQCWVEEGGKFVLWSSPNHRVVWPCVYGESHRTGVCFMKQSARQRTWKKIILDQKQTGRIFPFSKSRREQGPVAGDPAAAGHACRENYLRKRQTSRKCRHRHRWQMNTAPPHTIASQNHCGRTKPCPQLLKYHISYPGGCRKAQCALPCPH